MTYFNSSEDLKTRLGGFFDILVNDKAIGAKLKESKLIVKFNYKNPELSITADCTKPLIEITYNDTSKKPEVEMFMDADTAHKFWLGDVNLVMAIARRQMIIKGPIPRVLKLLPVIKPAYGMYKEYISR